jgi:phosphomannomutase
VSARRAASGGVGYDGRLSSPMLEAALVEGLTGRGVDVLRIGLGPTPMLYFAVHHLKADGGMMITGSHNPPDYNGFKMMLGKASRSSASISSTSAAMVAAGDGMPAGQGRPSSRSILAYYTARLLRT